MQLIAGADHSVNSLQGVGDYDSKPNSVYSSGSHCGSMWRSNNLCHIEGIGEEV